MRLNKKQLIAVRAELLSLFLAPGDSFDVRPPRPRRGDPDIAISTVRITPAMIPIFQYLTKVNGSDTQHTFWLQLPKIGYAHWDYQYDVCDMQRIPYSDPRAAIPRRILEAFHGYFPFLSSDNFLVNNGRPIA